MAEPARGLVALLAAYLLGSLPFAHWVTRCSTGQDIRLVGIGNPGARNVFHVVGKGWGAAVFALDAAKGGAAVALASALRASDAIALLVGPAAVLGHAFPVTMRFRGGKGLSTTLGVLLALLPWSTLAGLLLLALAYAFTHDFDRSLTPGCAGVIGLPPLLGYPWWMSLYALGLFLFLWALKLKDLAHQRAVWRRSGWEDVAELDWYGPSRVDGGESE